MIRARLGAEAVVMAVATLVATRGDGTPPEYIPRAGDGRKWLAPPGWTPGSGTTFRQYLWTLDGWQRLTAMPLEQRGSAVALSMRPSQPPANISQRRPKYKKEI